MGPPVLAGTTAVPGRPRHLRLRARRFRKSRRVAHFVTRRVGWRLFYSFRVVAESSTLKRERHHHDRGADSHPAHQPSLACHEWEGQVRYLPLQAENLPSRNHRWTVASKMSMGVS